MHRKVLRPIADKHQKPSAFNAESVTRAGFAVALATVLTGCGSKEIVAGTDFKILKKEGENYSEIDINKGLPADFYVWVGKDKVEENTNLNFKLGGQSHTIEWKDYSANNSGYQLKYDGTQGYVFDVNSIAKELKVELTNGDYNFAIKEGDNVQPVSVQFNQDGIDSITVDTTAPVINELSVIKGEDLEEVTKNENGAFYINSKTATITFEYDEPNFDSFAYSSNGNEKVDFNHVPWTNNAPGTITLGLSDLAVGANSISFTITDTAGNEITQEVKLFVDITAPTIGTPLVKKGEDLEVVTEDEGTFYINSQTATITFQYDEPNFDSFAYSLNGNEKEDFNHDPNTGTITLGLSGLAEGANSISFTITDTAGNATTKDLTVEVDTIAPQFYSKTMDMWSAGGLDWSNLILAKLNNEEIKIIPISNGKFDFYSDKLDYKPTNPNGENTFDFRFQDPLNEFEFPMNKKVYVKDVGLEHGVNIGGKTYNVYYDNNNEMSTNAFYSPTAEKFFLNSFTGDKLQISGNIIDKNLSDLKYFIDGAGKSFITVINDYNSFDHIEITEALSEGDEFEVKVVATDKAGNTATAKWEDLQPTPENTANFKVDTVAPTIQSITFSGQNLGNTDDYQIVELTNDITVQVSEEVESVSITLPAGEDGSTLGAQTVNLAQDPNDNLLWKASGVELPQGSLDSGYKKFLNGELLSNQITITATDLAGNTIDQELTGLHPIDSTATTSKGYMFSILPEIETVEIGGGDSFDTTIKGLTLNVGGDGEFNLGSITFKDYQDLSTDETHFFVQPVKVEVPNGNITAGDKFSSDSVTKAPQVDFNHVIGLEQGDYYALEVRSQDSKSVSGPQYLTVNFDSNGTVEYGSVWHANTKIGNPITEEEAIIADYLFWVAL